MTKLTKFTAFIFTHTVAREEDYHEDERDDDEVYDEMEEICIDELKKAVSSFCKEQGIDESSITYKHTGMDWEKSDDHYHFIYEFICPNGMEEKLKESLTLA